MFNEQEKLILGVIVFIYFIFLFGLSVYIGRKVKTYDDYNVAGRSVSIFPLILTFVGTAIGGSILLGYMTNGYILGMGQQWMNVAVGGMSVLFILFLTKRIRMLGEKHNMVTIGDFTAMRYGEGARIPTAISMLVAYCAITGMQFVAIATILNLTLGMSMTSGILIGWILLTLKTYFGGMEAVIIQDAIHGTIQTLGIFALFVVVLVLAGDWGSMASYAESMGEGSHLSIFSIAPAEVFVFMLTVGAYQFVRQDVWQRVWAAKDLKTSNNGYLISIVLSTAIGVVCVAIGVMSKYGMQMDIANPSLIYYEIIGQVLPFPLVIVMLIALLATVISTADSFFISAASSIVNDIIKPKAKNFNDEKMLKYSKLCVVIVSFISLFLALYIPKLVTLWITGTAMLVSGLLAPVLLGMFWKGATRQAGIISMWLGLSVATAWQLMGHPLGWHPVFIGLPVSIVTLVIVSFLTKGPEVEAVPEVDSIAE
ncbi:sodium:solute symporter family protein [Bacillus thermotolerans]|uniref:Sodium-solute symporter n=1 Tax=Bacillus thermotolerans TaxID=1221996 RepID=A0A0F5HXK9_BACTR|nr:sodium:solute symporter family protein [Bacillus thermotolerans]KKB38021.1 sodium-solute symporter [Bacillus thermotolerans]KKB40682.1 putative sodium-solute symporter [Bacillus thermotolerans]